MSQTSALNNTVYTYKKAALGYYASLSKREQNIILAALVIAFFLLCSSIYSPVIEMFRNQSLELTELENQIKNKIPTEIRYFQKLKVLRSNIEDDYKQVELREGTLSYLEKLAKDKVPTIQGTFTIDDNQPAQPFGQLYERNPFSLKFVTNNLEKLVGFLKELAYGTQPFIITKLDINKTYSGLDVTIDVVSISKKGK